MEDNNSKNKRVLMYWQEDNLVVEDTRRNTKYVLQEVSGNKVKEARKIAMKVSDKGKPDLNMDLYFTKLLNYSLIEPKLSDDQIMNLPGAVSMKMERALAELYDINEDDLGN